MLCENILYKNISIKAKSILTGLRLLTPTLYSFIYSSHLPCFQVNLSLSLRSSLYQSEKQGGTDLFQVLVNSVGSPLTEVNDVLIK